MTTLAQVFAEERRAHFDQKASHRRYYLLHKDVIKARVRMYKEAHPEKVKEWQKKHREANVEHVRAIQTASRLRHRDHELERHRRYYQEHKKEYAEGGRRRRASNPEAYRLAWMRRYTKMRGLEYSLTLEQWETIKASYHQRCAYCGRQRALHKDHVIPVAQGGPTTSWNIVPACRTCNSKKGRGVPLKPIMAVLL